MGYNTFQPIVTDSLVFNMDPFNTKSYNGVSNMVTDIVTGSTGSLVNGVTYSGKGFYFDGVNDYVDFGDFLDVGTNDMTINIWLNMIQSPPSYNFFVSKSIAAVATNRYAFGIDSSRRFLAFWSGSDIVDKLPTSTTLLELNKWYMLTMVVNRSSSIKLYLNGIEETITFPNGGNNNITSSTNDNFNNNYPFRIGSYTGGDNTSYAYGFNGYISQTIIYHRQLSATEILQNYNATKWRFVSNSRYVDNGLVFYIDVTMSSSYPGTGTTVYNLKGPETATLTNGPTFDGSSLYFDGVNDYASISSLTPYTGLQPHSYACWIKFVNGSGYKWVLNNGDSSTGTSLIIYGSKVGFFYGGGQAVVGGTTTLSPNTWYYITTTYDGNTGVKFYVNGLLDGTKSTTSPDAGNSLSNWANTGNNSPRINGWNNGAYLINCNINHLMVYNRKLESSEVLQNYNATKNRYT